MKHTLIFITTLFIGTSLYSQSINDYKYVVVSEKFNFLDINDEYELNSLTKFLFNKYGFEAYLKGELMPFSTNEQGCEALYADVLSDSGFIRTKLQVVLKNCHDEIIYSSSFGSSKDKNFKRAYHEALRKAFYDIQSLQYAYSGISQKEEKNVTLKNRSIEVYQKDIKITQDIQDADKENTFDDQFYENPTAKESLVYTSEDGVYKAIKEENVLTFLDGTKVIGVTQIDTEESFPVTTSQFSGTAFFLEERLIIQRKIKGVVELVEMIFTK